MCDFHHDNMNGFGLFIPKLKGYEHILETLEN